jgi:cytochrome c-type biogenesis protein CcsB
VTEVALTTFSNAAFGVALVLYLVAMVGYFHHLAFRRRRILLGARTLAFAGLAVHAGSVIARGLAAGRVPWGNLYEYVSMVGLLVVAVYLLVVERMRRTEAAGGFALGAAVVAMAGATLLYTPPGPLVPALNSYWLRIHVVAAMLGSALFTLGTIFSVLYLVQARRERAGVVPEPARVPALVGAGAEVPAGELPGPELPEDHAAAEPDAADAEEPPQRRGRLPSASVLDHTAYRTIGFAFPIWTFAVIAGAIWAEEAWGRYWGWDPKEVWSFVTWVVFAGYLHARATVGWRGTRAAVLAIAGFVALVFNIVVVNLVISGLHSYAGVQ